MCIVLLSTAHPAYALVLVNNRDVSQPAILKPKP